MIDQKPKFDYLDESAYIDWFSDSMEDWKAAVRLGPIAAGIAVGNDFFFYSGGIFDGEDCSPNINHSITGIGYGVDAETGIEYGIIRNSWGKGWGEKGYARIMFVPGETRGICQFQHKGVMPILKPSYL